MSWEFSKTTIQVARKNYLCEASDWITDAELDDDELSDEDKIVMRRAELDSWKIKKGEKYIKIAGKFDGRFCVFRARIDLNEICIKYDLYDYDT